MKVKSLHLTAFKRFTDLTVAGLPESAKLVVLAGPNGVGKSSLFEAFNVYLQRAKQQQQFDQTYHSKVGTFVEGANQPQTEMVDWMALIRNVTIDFHSVQGAVAAPYNAYLEPARQKDVYLRTSNRTEPDFVMNGLTRRSSAIADEIRPPMMISTDAKVADNYQRIVSSAVGDLFVAPDGEATINSVRERLLGELRDSIGRVLPDLYLEGPGNPLEDGTFLFTKGGSRGWRYKNLSGGEKAAFDLLLDFVVKKQTFDDTVFCIDEPETHLNTRVQGALLRELCRLLPEGCQLWVATHSIGMMRAAKDIEEAEPGTVSFLDFDGRDFDQPVEMKPVIPDRQFWKRQFGVAIGDLADLLVPERIVFCEGSRKYGGNAEHDARVYSRIFASTHPNVAFLSVGGSKEVPRSRELVLSVLEGLTPRASTGYLLDRDDMTDEDIARERKEGGRVLTKRNLETHLFSEEILGLLCDFVGKPELRPDILKIRSDALADAIAPPRSRPIDDLKACAPQIYQATKRLLRLTQCGNDAPSFAVAMLAPLVTPETETYRELEVAIFAN